MEIIYFVISGKGLQFFFKNGVGPNKTKGADELFPCIKGNDIVNGIDHLTCSGAVKAGDAVHLFTGIDAHADRAEIFIYPVNFSDVLSFDVFKHQVIDFFLERVHIKDHSLAVGKEHSFMELLQHR